MHGVFGWLGLFILVIPGVLTLGCLVGLVLLWIGALRRGGTGGLPTCGRCGYPTRGVSGLTCPECGADLREVGIVTSRQRGGVGPVVFCILWTVLLPLPALVATVFLAIVGPKSNQVWENVTLTPVQTSGYTGIQLSLYPGSIWATSSANLNMSVNYPQPATGTPQWAHFWLDLNHHVYSASYTGGNHGGQNPKQADIERWLTGVIGGTAAPSTADEAAELAGIILIAPTQGLGNLTLTHFTISNHNSGSTGEPAVWFVLLLVAFWIAIWIAGLVIYFAARRRRLALQKKLSTFSQGTT